MSLKKMKILLSYTEIRLAYHTIRRQVTSRIFLYIFPFLYFRRVFLRGLRTRLLHFQAVGTASVPKTSLGVNSFDFIKVWLKNSNYDLSRAKCMAIGLPCFVGALTKTSLIVKFPRARRPNHFLTASESRDL